MCLFASPHDAIFGRVILAALLLSRSCASVLGNYVVCDRSMLGSNRIVPTGIVWL